jgi:hypothetical protein
MAGKWPVEWQENGRRGRNLGREKEGQNMATLADLQQAINDYEGAVDAQTTSETAALADAQAHTVPDDVVTEIQTRTAAIKQSGLQSGTLTPGAPATAGA